MKRVISKSVGNEKFGIEIYSLKGEYEGIKRHKAYVVLQNGKRYMVGHFSSEKSAEEKAIAWINKQKTNN